MNTDLVQIGNSKKDNTSFKKGILKKLQKQFQEEWEITGGLSAPAKMPGYGYSTPADSCIAGSKLREIKGSACYSCYAMRGNYMYPHVRNALQKRLYSFSDPLWVPSMATLINSACNQLAEPYFRWHDAGDLQSAWHLGLIAEVCELTPGIKHWLPTREYKFVNDWKKFGKIPVNLVVRFSAHMIDKPAPKYNNTSTITSNETPVEHNSILCGAYTRDGYCSSCRLCWDKEIKDITYPKH
jgi:hypothetical protein